MKFAKGLLSEEEESENRKGTPQPSPVPASEIAFEPPQVPPVVEKNRLFETVEKEKSSERSYAAVFGIICVVVIAGGVLAYYMMMPGVGDRIDAPRGLEAEVREHFLTKEKRTATDIVYYKCHGFIWARVGVETRIDIPNPLLKIANYSAKATGTDAPWSISATPISSPESGVPCN